jgi:hypothetical protein
MFFIVISSLFYQIFIHYLLFINQLNTLLLTWIIVNIIFEPLYQLVIRSEKHSSWKVLIYWFVPFLFFRSLIQKSSVNILIINKYFYFVYTSRRCLTVVPKSNCTHWLAFFKYYINIIWYSIFICSILIFSFFRSCCIWPSIVIRA